MRAGDQVITLIEIDQPLCQLEYGFTPCQAFVGVTGSDKCHNTRATCQDAAAYSPGVLTLRFARTQENLLQYGPLIPLFQDISTSPASVNLAAMDKSSSGFGQREKVTLTMNDTLHSDLFVDKYRLERAYDPYTSGTFWGKWLARNPYHSGYAMRVYEGVIGETLDYMNVRNYIIDRIEGPTDGQVKIICKDLFSKVEARKALAPLQSRGELKFDITAVAGSATLNPAGIGNLEYPASGHVAIGDECITFTRSGDVLTLTQRGALNTDADDHTSQDLVQLVLSFVAQPPHTIAKVLLTDYAGLVDGVDFVFSDWEDKATEIVDLYTGRITEPTAVSDLIAELEQQAGFTLWPDVRDGKIKFTALRPSTPIETVNDNGWIVDKSLDISRLDSARISEVWVHYGQIRPNGSMTDRRNYYSTLIEDDEAAESETQYDGITVREVFSRWIPQFGRDAATRTGQRLLAMFRDAPLQAEFTMYADKVDRLTYADYFNLLVDEVQDEFGQPTPVAMAPLMIENGEDYVKVKGQSIRFPAEAPPGASEVVVYIENDAYNLNLRTIYDSLFATPTGSEIIRFVVEPGVKVGSTSTGTPSIRTGSWPAGVTLTFTCNGRVQGKGGVAGQGGGYYEGLTGLNGSAGGPAFQAEYAISIDNTDGELWGGGGGGGGGGCGFLPSTGLYMGGGGGGGGSGFNPGAGAAPGSSFNYNPSFPPNPQPGSDGGTEAGGAEGAGHSFGGPPDFSGNGGAGGAPGIAGDNGTSSGGPNTPPQSGGTGGATGNYIVGNSFVTWIANGDRRGGVA